MESSEMTAPCPCETERKNRIFSIGLPKCTGVSERRFPLTPEAVEVLTERGFVVKMEHGAAEDIHYKDSAYALHGAHVCERAEALLCDIVIHLAPLGSADIRRLHRGAMLLTLLHLDEQNAIDVKMLLERGVIAIALDLISDDRGNLPFADILSEIDGRAAMASASSILADGCRGKGILMGGIAGVVPCEVMIIGSGIAAIAAAKSAIGLGAIVRMFDNDVYRLRNATRELGDGVIASALHPGVLTHAFQSADVVIATDMRRQPVFGREVTEQMKRGVITYDLSSLEGKSFLAMPNVNLACCEDHKSIGGERVCFTNAGSAVARTAAMALSNTFISLLEDVLTLEGVTNALKLVPGLQKAAYTFLGKVVNASVAKKVGIRHVDINLFLQLS